MSRITTTVGAFFSPILDLLYPPVCLVCENEEAGSANLSANPSVELPENPKQSRISEICPKCWERLLALIKAQHVAIDSSAKIGAIVALSSYDPPIDQLIKRFKYDGFTRLGKRWGDLLLENRREALEGLVSQSVDLLLPTPLHIVNYKKRGFNQAAIISDILSEGLSVPVAEDSLVKVALTKNQSLLTIEERLDNLRGAFAGNPDQLEGKRVVLVDDVITTGATIKEIGKTAEEAGATIVGAIALASALDQIPEEIVAPEEAQ